jgi:hypothetical protein
MQWVNLEPHGGPSAVEFGCLRCGSLSPLGGTCEICIEALSELRALAGEYGSRMIRRALPWHPSWAAGPSS